ncbi:hypothetical protein EDD21DRAFT_380773 [Dissophora ornata]|nr:hypothetical protein EDD21DRAFT_380773 [Dissophora ornata]
MFFPTLVLLSLFLRSVFIIFSLLFVCRALHVFLVIAFRQEMTTTFRLGQNKNRTRKRDVLRLYTIECDWSG